MKTTLDPLSAGRPDNTLRVIVIGHVSALKRTKSAHQRAKRALQANVKYVLEILHNGPVEVAVIDTSGRGISDAGVEAAKVEITSYPDLMVVEDLTRITRSPRRLFNFLYAAIAAGVRVISSDGFDTQCVPPAGPA